MDDEQWATDNGKWKFVHTVCHPGLDPGTNMRHKPYVIAKYEAIFNYRVV